MGDDGRTEEPHRLPSNSRTLERQGEEVPLAEASLVDAEPADGRAENSDLSCQGDAAAVEDATQSRGEGEEATPLLLLAFLLPFSISASHWPTFLEARDQVSLEMQFSEIQSKAGEEWGTDLMANKA